MVTHATWLHKVCRANNNREAVVCLNSALGTSENPKNL